MSRKSNNMNKLRNVFGYINNNSAPPKPKKTNLMEQGSMVTLETMSGSEMAMVLKYIPKKELRDYLKENQIEYDNKSEIWKHNYAVLGHYKTEDINNIIKENKYDESPPLNLIIVKVEGKTSYTIIVGKSTELQLLFNTVKAISQKDESIPDLLNRLLNTSVMSLATKDMSRAYQEEMKKKEQQESESNADNNITKTTDNGSEVNDNGKEITS